jgi:hypothetical protein
VSGNAQRAENAGGTQAPWPGSNRYASSIRQRALCPPAFPQVGRERHCDTYRLDNASSFRAADGVEPGRFVDESCLGLGQLSELGNRQGVAQQQDGSLLLDSDDHHRGAIGAAMGRCASAVDHGLVEGVPELPYMIFERHLVPRQPKVLAFRAGSDWNKPFVFDVPSHAWFRPDG